MLDGEQPFFIADQRRPYLFRIAAADPAGQQSAGPMEMNQVRRRIQEVFPPESGLLRCGIHRDEGVCELAFHFPDPIRIYLSDEDEIANGIAFESSRAILHRIAEDHPKGDIV